MLPTHRKASFSLPKKGRRGFAVMVAIVLLAFIVLVLLSLSALVSTELQLASTQQSKVLARENALLGLGVAIGELQKQLGPDQRVSARADILQLTAAPAPEAARWTGVWNSDLTDATGGERLAWLVSGDVDAVTGHVDGAGTDAVTLVGKDLSQNNNDRVRAPRVAVLSEGHTWQGHYAWWVGDEGIKVDYFSGLFPRDEPYGNGDPGIASPENAGLGILPVFADFDVKDSLNQTLLKSEHLSLAHAGAQVMSDATKAGLRHNVSFASQGLLTDTSEGGLKQDLTLLFEDNAALLPNWGTDLPDMGLARSYYQLKDEVTGTGENASIVPRAQTATEHGVMPVLTMFMFHFGFAASSQTTPANLLVTMKPTIVLANPYNIHLDAADYEVAWSPEPGMESPGLVFRIYANGGAWGYPFQDMETLLGEPVTFLLNQVAFAPGEVKVFTIEQTTPVAFPPNGLPMINDGITPSGAYAWIDTGITLEPKAFDASGSLVAVGTVQLLPGFNRLSLSVNGTPAQTINSIFSPGSWVPNKSSGAVSMVDEGDGFSESIYFGVPGRIISRNSHQNRVNYGSSGTDTVNHGGSITVNTGLSWLVSSNLRSADHELPESSDYLWDGNTAYLGVYQSGGKNNTSHFLVDTNGGNAFWGYGLAASNGHENVVLFDVPRGPLLSLGQLQHLNVGKGYEPAFAIGNSWASVYLPYDEKDFSYRINEATWDHFFFSGYDGDAQKWHNPRVHAADIADAEDDPRLEDPASIASMLLVDGAFNVNSTNVDAWKAQLASLRNRPVQYFDASIGNTSMDVYEESELENPIFRYPLPTGKVFEADSPSDSLEAEMWKGFRNLSDEQIERLAGQIVWQVQSRGPFLSMADFVNRDIDDTTSGLYTPRQMGALQAAIDYNGSVQVHGTTYSSSDINTQLREYIPPPLKYHQRITGYATDEVGLPNFAATVGLSRNRSAPGYLTQADILTLLGSILTVRSDTFTIRAYGDIENKITGERITAVCEATVQRIAEPVEPDSANPWEPSQQTKNTMGRRFIITSLDWLDEDDI